VAQGAAGITCVADTTGRIFLMRRSPLVSEPGLWSCPAGRLDPGEEAIAAAVRELGEEAGYWGPMHIQACIVGGRRGRPFYHFVARVPAQFRPRINWENDAATWASLGALPAPIHPGMKQVLRQLRREVG
jgi:ADP-ribose pyrophosphatase YjhB (NUDIX family)